MLPDTPGGGGGPAAPADRPALQFIDGRAAELGGGVRVVRALPTRHRRLVGPWCFLDHIGPADVREDAGIRIGPHPHIGLQTVTWLFEGELLHRDSLGHVQPIHPGQLNLMTSGAGIAHSEESPAVRAPILHGVQLWIALPDAARATAPAFAHHPALPQVAAPGARITVLAGEALGERSPAAIHSPLVGLDLDLAPGASLVLPLRPDFEHALMVASGALAVEGAPLGPGALLYLGRERDAVRIDAGSAATRAVLIGGLPLGESILMWWNFVAREREELARACHDWNAGAAYFGVVQGFDGERLEAPSPPFGGGAGGASPVVNYP